MRLNVRVLDVWLYALIWLALPEGWADQAMICNLTLTKNKLLLEGWNMKAINHEIIFDLNCPF